MFKTKLINKLNLIPIVKRFITEEEKKLYTIDALHRETEPLPKYPTKSVKIKKSEEVPTKKPEDVNYNSKYNVDLDSIEEYQIVGAEIFKNSLKEVLEISLKNNPTEMEDAMNDFNKQVHEAQEEETYGIKLNPLKFQEPNKYLKNFTRRLYYDQAAPNFKQMFVPSYKFKIEPFNSKYVFKFPLINGSRSSHQKTIFRRNNFINGFIPPFNLNNEIVEDILGQLSELTQKNGVDLNSKQFQAIINDNYNKPEQSTDQSIQTYVQLVQRLVEIIPTLNHKLLPVLIIKMCFDVNLNEKKVWVALEQEILNNFHHFNLTELSQIYYASTFFSPKYTTQNFRVYVFDEIKKNVFSNKLTLDEMYTVMYACRNTKVKSLYDKLAEIIIERKDQISKSLTKPTDLSKILYAWACHKPKQYGAHTFHPQRDLIEKMIETYDDDLNDSIMKMNQDDLGRLTTSLYLLKSSNIDPYINRIERKFLKICKETPKEVYPFNLHSILRAFSKMKDNKMCGSDKFFDELEPMVIEMIESFKLDFQQFSDILFAYSVRGSGSPKLYNVFNKTINQDIEKTNNYHTLHNIVYHLLFTENKDVGLWKALLVKFNDIEDRLPIFYYRPFKIAGYFLDHAFNANEKEQIGQTTLFEFKDKFYDPEQVYDYVKYERLYYENKEYDDFRAMIKGRLVLFPLAHVVYHNMLIIHNSWDNRKIGINLWLDRDLVQKTKNDEIRVNKKCLLHSKMMKYEGWEILDITWKELFNMDSQIARDKFLHDWYHTVSLQQEKKGVFKRKLDFI